MSDPLDLEIRIVNLEKRIAAHSQVLKDLQRISQNDLEKKLEEANPISSGIGGHTFKIDIGGTDVFVKKIPISEMEISSDYKGSTSNYFNLPLYYQYGVGSVGFGVWRDLHAHQITTEWVISKRCHNFPILYHWCILPRTKPYLVPSWVESIDEYVSYWNHSAAVRGRIEACQNSQKDLVLFLEYLPKNLNGWLADQKILGTDAFLSSLQLMESDLLSTSFFMRANGLTHFDGHASNLLTDGYQLYFGDFGLANSLHFSLSTEELEFFKQHRNYDICFSARLLVQEALKFVFGDDTQRKKEVSKAYAQGNSTSLLPEPIQTIDAIHAILARYAGISEMMGDFFDQIIKNKLAPFPSRELEQACLKAKLI